ncbi:MAG: histidine kinase [Gemmatimonadales bacterium]|nr:histidine kinase [Gemmatimonadales bacterium]
MTLEPTNRPLRRAMAPLVALAIWLVIVVGTGFQNYATYTLKGEKTTLGKTLLWAFNDWTGWLLLGPLVFYLARRFRIERPMVQSRLALHALLALLVSAAHGLMYWWMEFMTGGLWKEMTPWQLVPVYISKSLIFGLMIYGALVAASHGIEYYRRYKDRELRATQLTSQLSKARLEVLKMQLQPHFLFNTLHAISALVTKNPSAADRIITRLGDLLRLSLQSNGTQEVPLKQELEFVDKYIDIQLTRFQDRLHIQVNAAPDALTGMVPSLLLQPLIENSIKYGVERHEAPSRIDVRARKVGDRLRLEVADDGPGFPATIKTPLPGRGLGLANTRARIAALYGDAGTLEIGEAPGGGALVIIDLPFRTDAGQYA